MGKGQRLYFSFASNMDEKQMRERVCNPKKVGIGYIPNYGITFNRKGSYRSGGVASIVREPGERTYGIIWLLSQTDFEKLDDVEDPAAYSRRKKFVVDEQGKKRLCYVYVAKPVGTFTPDPTYLELVISAAKKEGLPSHWISKLESFRSTQRFSPRV